MTFYYEFDGPYNRRTKKRPFTLFWFDPSNLKERAQGFNANFAAYRRKILAKGYYLKKKPL